MKHFPRLIPILGVLFALFAATPALTQKKPSPSPSVPSTPANTTFKVTAQSGTCPDTVRLWTSFRQYEGGGEHTVIADTLAIGSTAKLTSSGAKFAEFTSQLKSNFASCVGQATSEEEAYYQFRFQDKNVIFRVDLSALPSGTTTEMSYKGVVSSRPAVKWAIAD